MQKKILFLGCGKMGGAIRQNFLHQVKKENIIIIDRSRKIADFSSIKKADNNFVADVIIIAIKPQTSLELLQELSKTNLFHENTIFISILAGKNTAFFEEILGDDKKIIRLMPNLPILINEGVSPYFCNKNFKENEEKEVIDLFGKNLKLTKESLMNQVTAVSGSGPAYLFLFAKNMVDAAKKLGLDEENSLKLVKQTIFGASKMLLSNDNLELLINNVTSKGGTTQAALEVFRNEDNSLEELVFKAMNAACNRSKEI